MQDLKDQLPLIHPEGLSQMQQMQSSLKFNLYLLSNLPAAFFLGIKVDTITPEKCITRLPFNWYTKNPFRSTYFAAQIAAAELSTGLPAAVALTGKPSTAMLLVDVQSSFLKKADQTTYFHCNQARQVQECINNVIQEDKAQTITMESEGRTAEGLLVSKTQFTWSFKKRRSAPK